GATRLAPLLPYTTLFRSSGDGTIIARVESMQDTAPWAKAGVMIRESLDTNSKYAIAYLSPDNGTALQMRASTGGAASGSSNITRSEEHTSELQSRENLVC